MDLYKNMTISSDQFNAEAKVKEHDANYGETQNSVPGYSLADEYRDVLGEGSAKDASQVAGLFETNQYKPSRK